MIAFTCASYIHLIRAFQMHTRMSEFKDNADLYLTHPMFNNSDLVERIKNTNCFRKVFYVDACENGHFKLYRTKKKFDDTIGKVDFYNKLVSFNIENVAACFIYNQSCSNDGFEFHCCEDAPTIYKTYIPKKEGITNPFTLMGLKKECFHIDAWWTSIPELMKIPSAFTNKVYKLPPIDINDFDLLKQLNYIFGYKKIAELNSADILIMEESHYTDGLLPGNDDFEIFKAIKEHYIDKKIFIKLHPRTKINRFKNHIDVLPASEFPWELIVWNRILSSPKPLLQIGICCGTLVSDKTLFDYEGPKIALMRMFENKLISINSSRVDNELIKSHELFKNSLRNPSNFCMPNNLKEAMDELDMFLKY